MNLLASLIVCLRQVLLKLLKIFTTSNQSLSLECSTKRFLFDFSYKQTFSGGCVLQKCTPMDKYSRRLFTHRKQIVYKMPIAKAFLVTEVSNVLFVKQKTWLDEECINLKNRRFMCYSTERCLGILIKELSILH